MGGGEDPLLAHQGAAALGQQPISVQQHGHPGEFPDIGQLAIGNMGLWIAVAVVLHRLRVCQTGLQAANRMEALGRILGLDKTQLLHALLDGQALALFGSMADTEVQPGLCNKYRISGCF